MQVAHKEASLSLGAPFLRAEPIVKNTFLEFQVEDVEDETFFRCRRNTRTCPCQLGCEEVALPEDVTCAALSGHLQTARENVALTDDRRSFDDVTRHVPSPLRASPRAGIPILQTQQMCAEGDSMGQKCKNSMHLMPNFTTIVKNTFIDFEDDDLDLMQKCRRDIRTCPCECGEDSPAYVRLPTSPLPSCTAPKSPLQVLASSLQRETSFDTEDSMQDMRILVNFKPVVKNTFIELNVDGLDDEDWISMHTCRRNFKTCPYDLGCREDMPAYVSLPTSPSPGSPYRNPSLSPRNSYRNPSLSPRSSYRYPSLKTDLSASKVLDDEGLDLMQSLSYQECEPSVCGAAADLTLPAPPGDASLVHVCEHLLAACSSEPAKEFSQGLRNSSNNLTVPKVCSRKESLACRRPLSSLNIANAGTDTQSSTRQRLRSYGYQYAKSCSQPVQQPIISLDSLLCSDMPHMKEQSVLSSDTSFEPAATVDDEMSLFRNLIHEDQPRSTRQVPPPPPYTAPSSEMLGPSMGIMQAQPTADCCVSKAPSEQPTASVHATKATQSLPTTITEMCLQSSANAYDVAACSAHEGTDMEVNHDHTEPAGAQRRRPQGQRSGAAKPKTNVCSVPEDDVATSQKVIPSSEAATGLDAARSLAKKSHCRTHAERLWCHIYLDKSMLADGFDVVKKIIGREGCNTKKIYNDTSTKVRVRGQGSGHREARSRKEAPVHLMIALAADHGCHEDFQRAFVMTRDLLRDVSRRFAAFCRQKHQRAPDGPRFWVGESTAESLASLSDVLGDIQVGRLDLEL